MSQNRKVNRPDFYHSYVRYYNLYRYMIRLYHSVCFPCLFVSHLAKQSVNIEYI